MVSKKSKNLKIYACIDFQVFGLFALLCYFFYFRYLEQIQGLSEPDPNNHELYIDLEPHLGALLGVQARFQLNLILRPDRAFPPLANLTHPITVLPIFWVQEGYDQLPR